MKKVYYTIGEVCRLLELKPHILRYWENEFPQVSPQKTRGGTRRYTEDDIDILRNVKMMLHEQKYTIEGARKRLKETTMRKSQPQLEIEFASPKNDLKEAIIAELQNVRKLLTDSTN